MSPGTLFVVSAPSGTGKTTAVERLVRTVPNLVRSRSYTSRPIRPGEANGVHYNFVDPTRFAAMVDAGEFLEWAEVFGHRYGTSALETERYQQAGVDVVLVIDVQGGAQVRRRAGHMVGIFVLPPSFDDLEARLRGRSDGDVSEDELRRRLDTARREVAASADYDYVVVNDQLEQCVDRLRCIVLSERARAARMAGQTAEIIASFDSRRLEG